MGIVKTELVDDRAIDDENDCLLTLTASPTTSVAA